MSLKTTFMKKLAAKAKTVFLIRSPIEKAGLLLLRWMQNKRGLWNLGELDAPIPEPSETFSPIRSAD